MVTANHIQYLKDTLEPEDGYPYYYLYDFSEAYAAHVAGFKWENRYNSLRQDTQFFHNVSAIDDLVWSSKSIDEFLVKVDLNGWPIEAVNFAICYCMLNPGRFFSYDWRKLENIDDRFCIPPFSSEEESIAWHIYRCLFKKITNESLPMMEARDFIMLKL